MGKIYDEMLEKSEQLFKNSKNVKYWPYIGKGYFESKTKILVLGESHYSSDIKLRDGKEEYPWLTNEVLIADYLDQGYNQSFSSFDDFPKWIPLKKDKAYLRCYRNIANMLAHERNQLSDYVWRDIAFFNFFQRPVAPCPGSHEWLEADYDNFISQARAAFDEVMQKLTPDVVIIWGKTKLDRQWTPHDKVAKYPNTKFYVINHPSYGIRSCYKKGWQEFLKNNGFEETFAEHHPCNKRVEHLFSLCAKNIKAFKKISKWYAERSIGFNYIPEGMKKGISLMLIFNKDGSSNLQKNDLDLDEVIESIAFEKNVNDKIIIDNIIQILEHFGN